MVTACYGSVGSGKTYDAVCQLLEAMQEGRKTATINVTLRPDRCKFVLIKRGMTPFDADQVVGKHEQVFTLARFRQLTNAFLVIDEGHFWFPQNQYVKLSLEDILTASMSRKRKLDMHLISQLDGQINQNVRGLSVDSWLAHQLSVEPIKSMLLFYSWLMRQWGMPKAQRPVGFFYTRMQDAMGRVQARGDGTYRPEDKRMRFLNLDVSQCYDTLQQVSSPILDQMRDQARQEYLLALLKGLRRPEEVCPNCSGQREAKFIKVFGVQSQNPKETVSDTVKQTVYDFDTYPYTKAMCQQLSFMGQLFEVIEDDCMTCDGKGYVLAGEEHPDYEAARELQAIIKKNVYA